MVNHQQDLDMDKGTGSSQLVLGYSNLTRKEAEVLGRGSL